MPARLLRPLAWLVVLAAGLVLWSPSVPLPGRGRLDVVVPFTQLVAMRPLLVAATLVGALLWLPVARFRGWPRAPAAVLAVVALAAAIQIAPRATDRAAPAPDDAPGVTVLTANLLLSRVEPPVVVGLVRRTRADVLTLPETNAARARQLVRALDVASGERWVTWTDRRGTPARSGSPAPTSLLARAALRPVRLGAPTDPADAHGQVRIRLGRLVGPGGRGTVAAGADARVAAVHPLPPWPAAPQRAWRRDLLALRPLCRAGWIVGGDLNATVDHSPVRSVLSAGCRDAAAATGHGLRPTWSGALVVRPAIDHVLTGGRWRATAAGVLPIEGSDHRAVWARIVRR